MKNKHGGKRKGAGRPKKAPNTVKSVTINKVLIDRLHAHFGSRELTRLIKQFLKNLEKKL